MNKPTEKLTKIAVKDLANEDICNGHVYLSSGSGRKFYLMKPGTLMDPEFIKKHAPLNTVFDVDVVADEEVIQKYLSLFRELRYIQFERDIREKCGEIIQCFYQQHSQGVHFLSFAIACYREFCLLPRQLTLKMHETDINLFRKSIYSAAFSIIIGMSNDFYHFLMLRDFYNLTLGLDIGLCDVNYSYFVSEACNHESRSPGSGLKWMQYEKATELECRVFLNHPAKSYEMISSRPDILTYPELAEIILYQHELSNGQGFPRGIPKGFVSSWEAVVILAASLVEIQSEYDFEADVVKYVHNYVTSKLNELPVQRVHYKFCMALNYYKKQMETG